MHAIYHLVAPIRVLIGKKVADQDEQQAFPSVSLIKSRDPENTGGRRTSSIMGEPVGGARARTT